MIEQHVLPNGLTLLGESRPGAKSVSVGFFVKTGSRDEAPDVAGVSHFLEHMCFKGTPRRSAADVNREFDELGATYNAFTGEEYTVYYGTVLAEHRAALTDLLADMMRPSLRADDFDVEKKVILQEIALYKDRPRPWLLWEVARPLFYAGHPLGNSVLGSDESIAALTVEAMRAYHHARYSPHNLALVVTGAYDWRGVIAGAEQLCGRWTGPETTRKLTPVGARGLVKTVRADRFDRAHVAFFSPAPSAQDPRRFAAEVLAEVAGGGEGSRLYWALEEPGLAETASLSFDPADAAGAWIGYLSGDPEHAPDLTTRYRTVLDQLTREGVSADEVARNARKLAAARVLQGEASFRRMVDVGFDWMYGRRRESIDETADRLLAVTDREVNALLDERPFDSLTVVATGPLDTLT